MNSMSITLAHYSLASVSPVWAFPPAPPSRPPERASRSIVNRITALWSIWVVCDTTLDAIDARRGSLTYSSGRTDGILPNKRIKTNINGVDVS